MRNFLGALAVAMGCWMGQAAQACDPVYVYKKVVCYETVTEYLPKEVAYEKTVTRYDHCGRPSAATIVCYRTVQVPVETTQPVVKWVKVCL